MSSSLLKKVFTPHLMGYQISKCRTKAPSLVLHAGMDKTGSTAIQCFLRDNEHALSEQGLRYLRAGRGNTANHHAIHFKSLEGDFSSWASVKQELLESECRTGIVSFEGFYHLEASQLKSIRELLVDIEVKVIVYLRRQSDMVRSGVAQRIKQGTLKEGIEACTRQKLLNIAQDYLPILDRFSRIFGSSSLSVRRYEPGRWTGDNLLVDFLEAVDEDIEWNEAMKSFSVSKSDPNPTLDVDAVHLLDTLDRMGIDGKKRKDVVRLLLGCGADDRSTFVPESSAKAIDAMFSASNAKIAKQWFGEDELFSEPSKFRFRKPNPEKIGEYFSYLHKWLRRLEGARWKGRQNAVFELKRRGRIRVPKGWDKGAKAVIIGPDQCKIFFRASVGQQQPICMNIEGSWENGKGLVTVEVNGERLGRWAGPGFAFEIPGWVIEKRAQLVEMTLSPEEANTGRFVLDTMSYSHGRGRRDDAGHSKNG